MKVLHLLSTGGIGGIENLCKEICLNSDWENHVCFLFAGGPIAEEMKQAGIRVFEPEERAKISLRKLLRLIRLCRREKYDVINVHHEGASIQFYYLLLLRLFPGAGGVMTLHSCFERKYNYHKKSRLVNAVIGLCIRLTVRASGRIVGVSEAAKESYRREFHIDPGRMRVVYNGVDRGVLARGKDNRPCGGPPLRLVFIGRVVEVKGVRLLVEAMRTLTKELDLTLTVVGDGADRRAFERMSEEYGLSGRVCFAGFDRDIGKYFRSASVFLYPSVWQEAFGISIVEAMSYGLPCVVTKNGGIPEIVRDGIEGFAAPAATPEGICAAVRRAAEAFRTGESDRISTAAKARASEFSIDGTVRALKRVYRELAEEKRRGDGR